MQRRAGIRRRELSKVGWTDRNEPDLAAQGGTDEDYSLLESLRRLLRLLVRDKSARHHRFLPQADYFMDRWDRAKAMGFGEGSSVYDSCLVLGEVHVGKNTWIGPFTILDGSGGGLWIGDGCAISAGVHIYTHDTVGAVISGAPTTLAPVRIGNNVYIGPQTVVAKGVNIGDRAVIGTHSFVNHDVPPGKKAFGNPARIRGNSQAGAPS